MSWVEMVAILVALGAGVAGVFGDTWNKSERKLTAPGWGVLIFLVAGAGIAAYSGWKSASIARLSLDPVLGQVMDLRLRLGEYDYLEAIAATANTPRSTMAQNLVDPMSLEVGCAGFREEWVASRMEIDPQVRGSFHHLDSACDLYEHRPDVFLDLLRSTVVKRIDTLCQYYGDAQLCGPIDEAEFVSRIEEIFSRWPKDAQGQPLVN